MSKRNAHDRRQADRRESIPESTGQIIHLADSDNRPVERTPYDMYHEARAAYDARTDSRHAASGRIIPGWQMEALLEALLEG